MFDQGFIGSVPEDQFGREKDQKNQVQGNLEGNRGKVGVKRVKAEHRKLDQSQKPKTGKFRNFLSQIAEKTEIKAADLQRWERDEDGDQQDLIDQLHTDENNCSI